MEGIHLMETLPVNSKIGRPDLSVTVGNLRLANPVRPELAPLLDLAELGRL
jgi:hypothetical protein